VRELFALLLLVASIDVWQDVGGSKPAVPNRKASDSVQSAILKLQLQQAKIQRDWDGCNARLKAIPDEWSALNGQIEAQKSRAFGEAQLKPEDYDFSLETFEFTKKVPPPAEKKPEAKKDEKKPEGR
jgi:hypothetical protein